MSAHTTAKGERCRDRRNEGGVIIATREKMNESLETAPRRATTATAFLTSTPVVYASNHIVKATTVLRNAWTVAAHACYGREVVIDRMVLICANCSAHSFSAYGARSIPLMQMFEADLMQMELFQADDMVLYWS